MRVFDLGFVTGKRPQYFTKPDIWHLGLNQPLFWPLSGQRNILEMPDIEFFCLSFSKSLSFSENSLSFLGKILKIDDDLQKKSRFRRLHTIILDFLVWLCQKIGFWAWVWVFSLSFWILEFSPWVFLAGGQKKGWINCLLNLEVIPLFVTPSSGWKKDKLEDNGSKIYCLTISFKGKQNKV